ncbi:unnamed protein product [Nezara viridula]|uniref:Gustatory receptor n=1 Tax=Nezara viridula TaxID=85310 RepID=A0A9P0MVL4_NEZVI|nr:unnamed protein product [Nezara viridula]
MIYSSCFSNIRKCCKSWKGILRKKSIKQQKLPRRKCSSFHNDTKFIFSIAFIFGLFPVQNIFKTNILLIKTKLFSISYVYAFFMLAGFLIITIYGVEHAIYNTTFQIGEIKQSTAPFLFYGCCTTASYCFIDIAKKWPHIIRKWSKIENEVSYIQPPSTNKGLAGLIMTLGLVEHLFHNWVNTKDGNLQEKSPIGCYLKTFCFKTHSFLVDEDSYRHWKGVLIVMFSFHGTLLWTFIDVFIILVTSGLKGQIHSWNKFAYKHVKVSNFHWRRFRKDYKIIINFIKTTDKHINKIIGLSMINFYFISTQLLEEVRTQHDKYSERVFFLFSLSFLLLRTMSSFMSSASVHDEWLKVSTPIHACLSHTPEVDRLLAEVHSDNVAMSAFNMFHITRAFIMTMCGVVLTYELLILQTHEAENMARLQNVTIPE